MSRASKQKGWRWEHVVLLYLSGALQRVLRRGGLQGALDQGDILGVPDWTIQCKDAKAWSLAPWWEATNKQRQNGGTRWAVMYLKRWGKTDPALGWAVMPIAEHVALVQYVSKLEREVEGENEPRDEGEGQEAS